MSLEKRRSRSASAVVPGKDACNLQIFSSRHLLSSQVQHKLNTNKQVRTKTFTNCKLLNICHYSLLFFSGRTTVVPSSDYCCTETVLSSSDHYSIETVAPSSYDHCVTGTVAPSSHHYCIDIVVPSSDHRYTDTVRLSSVHYCTKKK